ncbi:FAD-dependent pyridine nucleotide reductase signature [Acididesulfobacillus acetoxydans]|uniref:Coenzyme A disulfide reductase n=1 Tax=Acididesulfobacillus acetoxydans TaxID=1561005 RepID=A0A8S0Y3U5_9FIRM|nr:FAD-dependent oxidoreductase [Acididesulfobacillus acetoxydans]CAA7602425.1 FAD-dependent pyridine nucleotide reductase signature [Acididesulfobacillus acetoxydans]CEJ08340.1 Coenzyme A disulfide reductase [Acididesulfobacillus acetoxydans]
MRERKIIIIGGVAGGASAAARLRRLDEKAEIIMLERGGYISFANCGLPYYIGQVIPERDSLLVQTPDQMKARFNLDVRIHSEVRKIEPREQWIEVKGPDGGIYRETYDELILSPGAGPLRPPIPGLSELPSFSVRNMEDIDSIYNYINTHKPKKGVVVGGGFVGLEMAENLFRLGIRVTLVEKQPQVLPPLDYEMAAIVHEHIREKGMELILGDGLKSCTKKGNSGEALLLSGRKIQTDFLVLALGVKPEVNLAKAAGLEIGRLGGIRVNEKFQTSTPHIYAIGDAIEVRDFVTGQPTLIPLAGPANKQGRMLADILCGQTRAYNGTQGTAIVQIFDLAAATTGSNEKTLVQAGLPYQVSYTHPASSATYYPGAQPLHIKLLFHPQTGKLYGGQVVGQTGVDKRIDDLAAAIRHGDTVSDLALQEYAYAPPFSSAKDPINLAGYVADNIVQGNLKVIHWQEIDRLNQTSAWILDVCTPEEYAEGHIQEAVNIPADELRGRLSEIPKDKEIVIYCKVGLRGYVAYRMLTQHGFTRVRSLSGGWLTYAPVARENALRLACTAR